ncbi:DnaJ and Myb-like DNA-binding domain-containing protein [Actinidia rufa]|uniref:DnaJ and Myb-like DNA-binding domain-containing protein n=1 Tax=Actinidia rufa TaxID=165716 RepID=A0A7J0DNN3_9ERIC|nr:DnaJ and Myb-like DNA-binding domain-containing protein [Actinidia rufa]
MVPQRCIRLISYSQEIVDGGPIYISSNSLPVKAFKLEPAGHAFHSAALRLLGCCEEGDADGDDETVPNDKEHTYVPSTGSYSTKGKKKSGAEGKQQDHYALLGLSHLRYLATEEQIRKSYRETALKHHPDKQAALLLAEETEAAKQAKKDEIENHFKAIQEAYEVLIDPLRRRIYDSTDEFDDEIPADCVPLRISSRFLFQLLQGTGGVSKAGENSHMQMNFDLEQAESRDHKRWMERQNAKLTALARKEEESARIQEKRGQVSLAKKVQEEEAARIAEEQRCQKEEEERRAAEAALHQKKTREKEKKLLRKERTRLRMLSASVLSRNLLDITEEDVENLCMSLEIERLRNLCEKMEAKEGVEQAKLLKEALGCNHNLEDQTQDKNPKANGFVQVNGSDLLSSSCEKKEKPWGREEIELLRKGMQKYPKGTSRRWEVISEYIGTGRPVEEILKATKTVLLQKPDSAKVFDSFLEKRKPSQSIASPLTTRENSDQDVWSAVQERALVQALKTFPKETSQRWERVAAAVPGKTVNQCKKKFALLKENFRNKKNVFNRLNSGLRDGVQWARVGRKDICHRN